MDTIRIDLRYALRTLRRSPLFALVAIVSLALGVGTTTVLFHLVDALHLRAIEIPGSETLVDISETSTTQLCAGCGVGTSYASYVDWSADATSFAAMAAYTERSFAVGGDEAPELVGGAVVSVNLFGILAVAPAIGRSFTAGDVREGAAPVVLLSDRLWRRRFAGDRHVLGSPIRLNGEPHTIIGVMPSDFRFPEMADLWVPIGPHAISEARDERGLGVVARLAPGVGIAQAEAEMSAFGVRAAEAYPATNREWSVRVQSLRDAMQSEPRGYFWTLLGAGVFVLLIVCANIAGLVLARVAGRHRELAIRAITGAPRGRIVRQLFVEALVVAFAGGALGLLIAAWGIDLVRAGIGADIPYWIRFGLDGRAAAFAAVSALVAGLGFGLGPALAAAPNDPCLVLKEGSVTMTGGRRQGRTRAALVVAELALALVLLGGAGLMVKTFLRLNAAPVGYDARGLVQADLVLLDRRFDDPDETRTVVERIVDRVRAVGGVTVAAVRTEFLAGFGATDRKITVEGIEEVPDGVSPRFALAVTPSYVATLGLRVVRGRDLAQSDGPGAPQVVLVNEQLARDLWSDGSAIGRRIKLGARDEDLPWWTVVGVVSNVDGAAPDGRRVAAHVYAPFAQWPGRNVGLLVRGGTEPMARISAIRDAIAAAEPDVPITDIRTGEQDRRRRFLPVRIFAVALSSFAAFACLLAAMGVYGLVAYTVVQRTREIGIRVALGAGRGDILRLIGRHAGLLAGLGLALGLAGSAVLTRIIGAMLFGTNPLDPWVFAVVCLLFVGLTLLASWAPAHRALRLDAVVALRSD